MKPKPHQASKEIIWHVTCSACGYYWTYPTMNTQETLADKTLHCPLCGAKAPIAEGENPDA